MGAGGRRALVGSADDARVPAASADTDRERRVGLDHRDRGAVIEPDFQLCHPAPSDGNGTGGLYKGVDRSSLPR